MCLSLYQLSECSVYCLTYLTACGLTETPFSQHMVCGGRLAVAQFAPYHRRRRVDEIRKLSRAWLINNEEVVQSSCAFYSW